MAKIIGANVIVEAPGGVIVGQRGVSLEGGDPDMIDVSDVHDFPNRQFVAGWNNEQTITLNDAVLVSGEGGFAYWSNLAAARTPLAMTITLGDSGDEATGDCYLLMPSMSADMSGEATMSMSFRVTGGLTWSQGS